MERFCQRQRAYTVYGRYDEEEAGRQDLHKLTLTAAQQLQTIWHPPASIMRMNVVNRRHDERYISEGGGGTRREYSSSTADMTDRSYLCIVFIFTYLTVAALATIKVKETAASGTDSGEATIVKTTVATGNGNPTNGSKRIYSERVAALLVNGLFLLPTPRKTRMLSVKGGRENEAVRHPRDRLVSHQTPTVAMKDICCDFMRVAPGRRSDWLGGVVGRTSSYPGSFCSASFCSASFCSTSSCSASFCSASSCSALFLLRLFRFLSILCLFLTLTVLLLLILCLLLLLHLLLRGSGCIGGGLGQQRGSDRDFFGLDEVVGPSPGDQQDQAAPAFPDHLHHLLVAAVLHVNSAHLDYDVIILQPRHIRRPTLHHLRMSTNGRKYRLRSSIQSLGLKSSAIGWAEAGGGVGEGSAAGGTGSGDAGGVS
ncbi:hypothetical protein JZ751_010798 [Albula glossodonta]|uniref:Uncharacterized protein n=1 Tax=Albula glossodonta TaxID=121402 RepID=A0A8T2MZN3_9TELE|nr:hypothetical protein JZ751_010798 [Albula glossodonta]